MPSNIENLLTTGASALGVPLAAPRAESFIRYLDLLLKWNRKVSLTSITDPKEVVVKHFLDSLALCRLLPDGPFIAADIGAGAGLPGLAVRIARQDMALTAVEPDHRKAAFIKHVARTLGLGGVTVLEARVESIGADAGPFDVVFSRAFREPARLLPLIGPLMAPGGIAALSLGPETAMAAPPGWEAARTEEITLPFSRYKRTLAAYKKSRTP